MVLSFVSDWSSANFLHQIKERGRQNECIFRFFSILNCKPLCYRINPSPLPYAFVALCPQGYDLKTSDDQAPQLAENSAEKGFPFELF